MTNEVIRVKVIFTCYNRKEKTLSCIKSLITSESKVEISYIIIDDNSSDGTKDEINKLNINSKIIIGNGSLFWAGGMRVGINEFIKSNGNSHYVLLVNDDVQFYPDFLVKLIKESRNYQNAIIVGATCDDQGVFTYGGIRLSTRGSRYPYYDVMPGDNELCDTFNCNCVLIPTQTILDLGSFDKKYTHSIADLDFGLRASKSHYKIFSSNAYVGVCKRDSIDGTWKDKKLKRIERIRKKESPKGPPTVEWFYFIFKHFGFLKAVKYSITPYIRILLGK